MMIAPLSAPLPVATLAKRSELPPKPRPVTLSGRFVRLEPLIPERDAAGLFEVSNGSYRFAPSRLRHRYQQATDR